MPRTFIRAALAVALTLLAFSAGAYAQDSVAREAEWRAYKLPTSNFVRYVDPSKTIMFRVPAGWQQQGAEPIFKGPEETHLQLVIEKVPDGIPLQALVAGALQNLRNLPGGPDSLKIRRTQLSGVEAREIAFELADARGTLSRRILLCAVDGANAVTLVFIAPLARAAELEPYFKAVAQSAVIFRSHTPIFKNDFHYEDFESLRKSAIKDSPAARIDEVQSLVSELDGGDSALRARMVTRLASIFAASPDSAIDLVLEQRPLVRAATIEAIAASGNKSLDPFLFIALSDPDSYVAARAAIAVAARPDAVPLLRSEIGSSNYTMLLRAAAFLDEKARIQIATELFNGTYLKPPRFELRPPLIKGKPAQAPPPPPIVVRPPGQQPPGAKKPVAGPKGPKEVMEVPGGVPGGVAGGVYLSNLSALISPNKKGGADEVSESGALKMSNAAWENSYQLSFAKAGWASLFSRFEAKSLASPRELLPRSTLGYIFARPDLAALWRQWGSAFFGPETSKNLASVWAMDFDKEIVPELGNEFGAGFEPFLTPTHELRSDDPTVIKQALEIVGADREAWSVARKLSDWTFKNLKWKRVDKAYAAQTLATREADCLEFSQLFVAMARSLRLPARIVSGLAYGAGSFGGHAWVEVWAGEWVELDPTWGTDFVDATHIRTASGELISYAALNLIEVEVLEAPRAIPDFQRNAKSLAEKLCEDLPTGSRGVLSLALDPAALTDEHMGAGTWSGMTDREREQMSSAYLRFVAVLSARFKPQGQFSSKPRLVGVTQSEERADALLNFNFEVMRFKFAHRGEAWTLVEIVYSDSGYRVVNESLQPVIQAIRARRSGKPTANVSMSAQTQILLALEDDDASDERIMETLRVADEALKEDPKNQTLRHLKAMCLSSVSEDAKKSDEAVAIWKQLSEEDPPFAPALLSLAAHYQIGDNKDSTRAVELLQRYAALLPDDPTPHSSLADLYESEGYLPRAEAERRAEIERDPLYPDHYTDLAELLAVQKRYDDACAAIDEGAKHGKTADELFASLFHNLYDNDRETVAEELGAARPERLNRNADALITLAQIRIDKGSARESLPLLKSAVGLAPKNGEALDTMAEAYRKLANWQSALAQADAAIKINAEDATAHYHRACALARLGRKTAALAALKRAIEIDSEMVDTVEDEEDLKPLAQMPEFKKLVATKPEK